MSFTSLRNQMQSVNSVTSYHEYTKKYLATDAFDNIQSLNEKYLEHLFGDVAGLIVQKDFKKFLGGSRYNGSNELAKNCVVEVFWSKDIFGWKIKSWLDTALKSFDNILLVLIQEVMGETIKSYHGIGHERHKYQHLIDKGGDFSIIGSGFDTAYGQRNDVTHIEILENGKRRQINLSKKQLDEKKEIALKNLHKALNELYSKI